jgi:hypothetical protein
MEPVAEKTTELRRLKADSLPGLTTDDLEIRFRLASAPVSPAPVVTSPAPGRTYRARPVSPPARPQPRPRPAPRPVRSHRAPDGRARWERRYLQALLLGDLVVGFGAAAAAFGLRFGDEVTTYNQGYALLSLLLPLAFVGVLAANRAYERRYLYVGTDEYQRVLRAGLAFTALLAIVAYAFEFRPARGYVSCRSRSHWRSWPRSAPGSLCASGCTGSANAAPACAASSWSATNWPWSPWPGNSSGSATTGSSRSAPASRHPARATTAGSACRCTGRSTT